MPYKKRLFTSMYTVSSQRDVMAALFTCTVTFSQTTEGPLWEMCLWALTRVQGLGIQALWVESCTPRFSWEIAASEWERFSCQSARSASCRVQTCPDNCRITWFSRSHKIGSCTSSEIYKYWSLTVRCGCRRIESYLSVSVFCPVGHLFRGIALQQLNLQELLESYRYSAGKVECLGVNSTMCLF